MCMQTIRKRDDGVGDKRAKECCNAASSSSNKMKDFIDGLWNVRVASPLTCERNPLCITSSSRELVNRSAKKCALFSNNKKIHVTLNYMAVIPQNSLARRTHNVPSIYVAIVRSGITT